MSAKSLLPFVCLAALMAAAEPVLAQSLAAATESGTLETVVVSARRRAEDIQGVPISMSVVSADTLSRTSTYNTGGLTQLVPSLNYSSPNPRNTAYTIRGLGSSVVAIAQANDGLEPGVGFYVDEVYQARPATAAFDFVDVDHVEVLRGPQGTVFGKNTTAGAISITTKAPSFENGLEGEASGGNLGFFQGKFSATGALVDNVLAVRVSGSLTRRGGVIHNVTTGMDVNDTNAYGARASVLYRYNDDLTVRLSGDFEAIDQTCCTQSYVRVGTSLKPAASQYPALAALFSYKPPSTNVFDRLTDIDAPVGTKTSQGGASINANWNAGFGTFTSISAWRFWNWDAANDRDYTSVRVQYLQHIPSTQVQYSQEFRLASNGVNRLDYVAGLYYFYQQIRGRPNTQYGADAAYWLLGTGTAPANPANLLDHYETDGNTHFSTLSYAAFAEATWHVLPGLNLNAGLRYTAESKFGSYVTSVFGGPPTTNATLITRQLSILRPQSYTAGVSEGNPTGRVSLDYKASDSLMAYVSYSKGFKSGGINMSGLPLNAANLPALNSAVVKPEKISSFELGVKRKLFEDRLLFNINSFDTNVRNFQTNVVDTGPGALRGYLANIGHVEVKGVEMESAYLVTDALSAHLSATWSDGVYKSYTNGPCPLEKIAASTTVCDLTGKSLSNLPKWTVSAGVQYRVPMTIGGHAGDGFISIEETTRSSVFGDPSDSIYTRIAGYSVFNAALGFKGETFEAFVWAKNLLDQDYLQNVTVQAGNSGLVVGTPNDPRAFGITLKARY